MAARGEKRDKKRYKIKKTNQYHCNKFNKKIKNKLAK